MSTLETLDTVIEALQAARTDAEKFDKGNSSAGTRLRKAAQDGKAALHALRGKVQELKNERTDAA